MKPFSLFIIRQRKRLCEIGKFWISNISKSNRTILMKIYIHNIYITNKIVYKPAADSSSRSREITIEKKGYKNFNLKYLWNLWTNHFAQRSRPRAIQNLPPQGILKGLRQLFHSRNRWMYKTHFIHFSGFTFLLIKKEPW